MTDEERIKMLRTALGCWIGVSEWLDKTPDPRLEVLAWVKTLPALLSKLSSVRPRTLGVDGPPTEWPVIVVTNHRLGNPIFLATEPVKGSEMELLWSTGVHCYETHPDDRYVPLRALLELANG